MLFISFIFSFFLAQCLKRLRYNPLLNARTCFLICFTPSNWVQQIQALTHNTHTHTITYTLHLLLTPKHWNIPNTQSSVLLLSYYFNQTKALFYYHWNIFHSKPCNALFQLLMSKHSVFFLIFLSNTITFVR